MLNEANVVKLPSNDIKVSQYKKAIKLKFR